MQQHQAALQSVTTQLHGLPSPPIFLPTTHHNMMNSQRPSETGQPLNLSKPKQHGGHRLRSFEHLVGILMELGLKRRVVFYIWQLYCVQRLPHKSVLILTILLIDLIKHTMSSIDEQAMHLVTVMNICLLSNYYWHLPIYIFAVVACDLTLGSLCCRAADIKVCPTH